MREVIINGQTYEVEVFEFEFDYQQRGPAGTSGTSGVDGKDSGFAGTSGTSGVDGKDSGFAGTSGTSGIDGEKGDTGTYDILNTSGKLIEPGDEDKLIITTGDLIIPNDSTDDFEIGTVIKGSGVGNDISILKEEGVEIVSLDNLTSLREGTLFTLIKIDNNRWLLDGTLMDMVFKKQTGVGDKWSYAIKPSAKDSVFYGFEDDWFYVVKDYNELMTLINKGDWSTSTNTNLRVDITDKNGLTKSIPMNNLITTRVTDMSELFNGYPNSNQFIGNWDTESVTRMYQTFYYSRFDQDISGWCVNNVTNMYYMFEGATNFNQDLSGWSVNNVTNMDRMFRNATNFNQNLSNWCVEQFPTMPSGFDTNTPAWLLPKPVWGTCP